MKFGTILRNIRKIFLEELNTQQMDTITSDNNYCPPTEMRITDAMQNPRKGHVIDWPYTPCQQPGPLMYQNPDSFLQSGELLRNSNASDKAPYMTEALNKHRNEFFMLAMGYLNSSGVVGDYHEYGCYSATTFRMALTNAALFDLIESNQMMRFNAFDSFEGLPEVSKDLAEGSNWVKGSMAMSEDDFIAVVEHHNVYPDRVKTYPGFFKDSLSEELKRIFIERNRKISFVNIDCDLYESAVDVFNFIEPILQTGTLIYMDDWYCGYNGSEKSGVAKAFHDFVNHYDKKYTHFRDCGWWGKSFIVQ